MAGMGSSADTVRIWDVWDAAEGQTSTGRSLRAGSHLGATSPSWSQAELACWGLVLCHGNLNWCVKQKVSFDQEQRVSFFLA